MKKKFSEITIHKQLDSEFADGGCIVELENYAPSTMAFHICRAKLQSCIIKEFNRLPVGSTLRIMVLTEEREVKND